MPGILLTTHHPGNPIPAGTAGGRPLLHHQVQFRCRLRFHQQPGTWDGVIDTGSPFTWLPETIWRPFRPGVDYDPLPYQPGYTPPRAAVAGWTFRFRMARLLGPVTLLDYTTRVIRHGPVVQLADGNPPIPPGSNKPVFAVIGVGGGLLDDTKLVMTPNPQTGSVDGILEF